VVSMQIPILRINIMSKESHFSVQVKPIAVDFGILGIEFKLNLDVSCKPVLHLQTFEQRYCFGMIQSNLNFQIHRKLDISCGNRLSRKNHV